MKVLLIVISLLHVLESQKNLSPDGIPSQSSVYYWKDKQVNMTADLAISGGPNDDFVSVACSVTLANPIQYVTWWMLTFPVDTVYITNVKIYYRKNTPERLAGYSLYVSNSSTTKNDGYLCYHHEGPGIPPVIQNVNCNYLGQYVIFYNERNETATLNPPGYSSFAILELCYIEINGCYKGRWGSDCSKPCPVNCVSEHCHPGNGRCVWGCNPDNCLNDICDPDTGVCTNGCKLGQLGDYCDKSCESGKFGHECLNTCHCMNQPCDPPMGVCPSGGCERGYTNITCSTECSPGYYGYNCNESCDGCISDSCDRENGTCTDTSGCKPGWQSGYQKCDEACVDLTYGQNCNEKCPDRCYNKTCHLVTGACLFGCIKGWNNQQCYLPCLSGSYGVSCESRCDTCVNKVCERFDGNCTYGCIGGFKGHNCQLTATPQSADSTDYSLIYTGVGAVVGTTLVCVIIFLVILRCRRQKKDGSTPEHNGHTMGEFRNSTFTNDDANTVVGADNADASYEDTKPSVQEHWYDETKPPVQDDEFLEPISLVQDKRNDDTKLPVQDKRNDDTKPPVQDKRNDDTKPPVKDKRNDDTKPPVQDDLYIEPTPPVQDDQYYIEMTLPVKDQVYESIDEDV